MAQAEPLLRPITACLTNAPHIGHAVGTLLAADYAGMGVDAGQINNLAATILVGDLEQALLADIAAVLERDPAARNPAQVFLFYKGFVALQSYRLSHKLWSDNRHSLAWFLQGASSKRYTIDIHPAAVIGRGIMIDHGHGLVIGETAVVGDHVSILHNVTLGGTGKQSGDRHPKIGSGVMIGAGAKILGNITVGTGSRIAAGSVVLQPVPPHVTVAGVPARIIGGAGCDDPASAMDQTGGIPELS